MSIILIGSNKGGVGKTTLAVNIATYFLSKGVSVGIIKAEKNNELLAFSHARNKNKGLKKLPIIDLYKGGERGSLEDIISVAINSYDYTIIDCAGYDSVDLRESLTYADLFLTPIKPSSLFEKNALLETVETLKQAKQYNADLKSYAVFNRIKPRDVNATLALANLLETECPEITPVKTRISELSAFELATNSGHGVHETKASDSVRKARAQIELLVSAL